MMKRATAMLLLVALIAHGAETVLVEKGVPAARLESKGYGQSKPIGTNRTNTWLTMR